MLPRVRLARVQGPMPKAAKPPVPEPTHAAGAGARVALWRIAEHAALSPARHAYFGAGAPLDPTTRATFEPAFGTSLADVRLHRDPIAGALDARAFTLGRHVVLAPDAPVPSSPDGRRLLAHELAHVAHDGVPVGPVERVRVSEPNEPGERAAEAAAAHALRGERAPSARTAPPGTIWRQRRDRPIHAGVTERRATFHVRIFEPGNQVRPLYRQLAARYLGGQLARTARGTGTARARAGFSVDWRPGATPVNASTDTDLVVVVMPSTDQAGAFRIAKACLRFPDGQDARVEAELGAFTATIGVTLEVNGRTMSFVPSDLFSDPRATRRDFEQAMGENLGDLTLHELGHQLGHAGHTESGTMRATRTISSGSHPTGFSEESLERIRTELGRRAPDPERQR